MPGRDDIRLSNISVALDNYDDVFSDFDPRPYDERVLSDDFLFEVQRICKEKSDMVSELRLLMPETRRNEKTEAVITKRIHAHFKDTFRSFRQQVRDIRKRGVLFIAIGIPLMLLASYIYSLQQQQFWMNMLFVVLEPAGWFMVWFGLDNIFYTAREKRAGLEFYRKMSRSKVIFLSYKN